MTPNFALSLSHDGILLLHRADTEWQAVGKADPQAADLAEQLAAMKSAADALAPEGLRCKIVIPSDQIKFLTIDAPQSGPSDNFRVAAQALDGATPYDVEDLVFDVFDNGTELAVAAVARETLAEAEKFSVEHGFTPVSYVADANPELFAAEAVFRTVAYSADNAAVTAVSPDAAETETPDTTPVSRTEIDLVSDRRIPTFRTEGSGSNSDLAPGFRETPTKFSTERDAKAGKAAFDPTSRKLAQDLSKRDRKPQHPSFSGAREFSETPRRSPVGLILAGAAVASLGAAAFFTNAMGISLFDRLAGSPPTAQFTAPQQPALPAVLAKPSLEDDETDVGAENTGLSDEDVAVLDALRAPQLKDPSPRSDRTEDELRAAYAVTGIWPIAPDVPAPPPLTTLDTAYASAFDPVKNSFDAVALPDAASFGQDMAYLAPSAPAPAGTRFDLDARGMVIATPSGAMNADGVMVFAGSPPFRPPGDLIRIEKPGEDLATRIKLAGLRPKLRPDDLTGVDELEKDVDLPRAELALLRPKLRPAAPQQPSGPVTEASLVPEDGAAVTAALIQTPQPADFANPTARAIAVSLRPDQRPKDFQPVTARAQTPSPSISDVNAASVARATPRVVAPRIPSSASVSREATIENALNLRRVNLIGVYGKPTSRRALVRLKNGRYKKVQVGDRIDGGRVSAIGDSELRYQKSGRSIVLTMPQG